MPLDRDQLDKPVRKLRKIIKNISTHPSPEEVHDLRTNTRRLEATLAALSLDCKTQGRRLLKDLPQLRKRAGKVRDMDVLTGFVASVDPPAGEQDCHVQLLEHLGAERQKHGKKLYAAVSKRGAALRGFEANSGGF